MSRQNITYQLEIDFKNTNLNNSTFGIASGVMYLTTGENYNYSGVDYVADILTTNSVPKTDEYADFQSGGAYANFSTININLNLTTGLLNYLRSNSVVIRGASVTYKHSIDRAEPVADWGGKVDDHSMSRSILSLVCVDEFNAIHSTQPSAPISSESLVSSNEDPIPLVIGKDSFADLVPKSTNPAFTFNLRTGVPSLEFGNVQILGYSTDETQIQGSSSLGVPGRMFHPKGWNWLRLWAGKNSTIQAGALVDYTLVFDNEITGRKFFAKVRSSGASTAILGTYYYVEVVLDKAVPFELEEIPDEDLYPGWPIYDQDEELTTDRENPLPNYYRYSKSTISVTGAGPKSGKVMPFSGRRWANVDRTGALWYGQSYYAFYPLNLPTSFPHSSTVDPLDASGAIQWEPIERITKAGFKPFTWESFSYDASSEPTLEEISFSNFLDEPIFTTALKGSFRENFLQEKTTAATLIHNDVFADFWLAQNGEQITISETPIYNKDGDRYLRNFDYENGVVKVSGPEWAHRIGEFENDLTELTPLKAQYLYYNTYSKGLGIYGDQYLAHSPTYGGGRFGDIVQKYGSGARVDIQNFACSGIIFDTSGGDFDFLSNDGETWRGTATPVAYRYTPGPNFTEVSALGRVPAISEKQSGEGPFWRSASDCLMEFNFENVEKEEFAFCGRIFVNASNTGYSSFTEWNGNPGLDLVNVHVRIQSYDADPFAVGTTLEYDSNWVSISTHILSDGAFAQLSGGNEIALVIGDVSFDLPNVNYIFAGNLPHWLKDNYENSAFIRITLRVTSDAKDNVQIGLQPSFVNMVKFEKADGSYTEIASDVSGGDDATTYADGVLEVFTDFDKAPSKIDYTRGELRSTYSSFGGGNPVIGRQITRGESTFKLCSDLAKRGFFGIGIDNAGKRVLKPWLYQKSPVKKFSVIPQDETPSTPWTQPVGTVAATHNTSRGMRSKIWDVDGVTMGVPSILNDSDLSRWFFFKTTDGGETWVETGEITNPEYGHPEGCSYGNGVWAVVGGSNSNDGAFVWRSVDDGTTWTKHQITSYRFRDPKAIWFCEASGLFVVSCTSISDTNIYTSPDCVTWTSRYGTGDESMDRIGFDGQRIILLGSYYIGTGIYIHSSADGITWEKHNSITGWLRSSPVVGENGVAYMISYIGSTYRIQKNTYPYLLENWETIKTTTYRRYMQIAYKDGMIAVMDYRDNQMLWSFDEMQTDLQANFPSGWNNTLYGLVIREDKNVVMSHRFGDFALLNLNGYSAGDEVGYNGGLWRSLANNNPFTPSDDNDWFFLEALAYSPISEGSLTKFTTAPYSTLYTHVDLKYSAGADGQTKEFLIIDKTEEDAFPDPEIYTSLGDELTSVSVSYSYQSKLSYFTVLTSSLPSDFISGAILLVNIGADEICKIVGVTAHSATESRVYIQRVSGAQGLQGIASSIQASSGILEWETFVRSSENIGYGDAKILWENFRSAYLRRGGRNDLSSDLAVAPELKSDENRSGQNVIEYMKNLINWVTFSKEKAKFKTDIISGFGVRVFDAVYLRDPILTAGVDFLGWVYKRSLNQNSSECDLEIIFDKSPFDPIDDTATIDENIDTGSNFLPFDNIDELIDNGVDPLPSDNIDEGEF